MTSLTQTVKQPYNRHDYNGIARVSPTSDRGNVKIAWHQWIANTYVPAEQNAKPITNITQSNPPTVTSPGHGFVNGNNVIIVGVDGMIEVNEHWFTIGNVTANTFTLNNVNATSYGAYLDSGNVFLRPAGFTYSGLVYT